MLVIPPPKLRRPPNDLPIFPDGAAASSAACSGHVVCNIPVFVQQLREDVIEAMLPSLFFDTLLLRDNRVRLSQDPRLPVSLRLLESSPGDFSLCRLVQVLVHISSKVNRKTSSVGCFVNRYCVIDWYH